MKYIYNPRKIFWQGFFYFVSISVPLFITFCGNSSFLLSLQYCSDTISPNADSCMHCEIKCLAIGTLSILYFSNALFNFFNDFILVEDLTHPNFFNCFCVILNPFFGFWSRSYGFRHCCWVRHYMRAFFIIRFIVGKPVIRTIKKICYRRVTTSI